MKASIENVLMDIFEANVHKNSLTPEEILKRFPHAVRSFSYVGGKLKVTLHKPPKSLIPLN